LISINNNHSSISINTISASPLGIAHLSLLNQQSKLSPLDIKLADAV